MFYHKMADFLILGYFFMVTRQPLLLQVSYLQVTRNIIHSLRMGTKSSKEDMGRNGDGESRGKKIQWVGIKQSLPQPRRV